MAARFVEMAARWVLDGAGRPSSLYQSPALQTGEMAHEFLRPPTAGMAPQRRFASGGSDRMAAIGGHGQGFDNVRRRIGDEQVAIRQQNVLDPGPAVRQDRNTAGGGLEQPHT